MGEKELVAYVKGGIVVKGAMPMEEGGVAAEFRAGSLRLAMDATGRVTALSDVRTGAEYCAPGRRSDLVTFRLFGDEETHRPSGVTCREDADGWLIEFSTPIGVTLVVKVVEQATHARLTLLEARDASSVCPVEVFHWGPLYTTLTDPPGEVIGLVRNGDFSVGMLSLEPGTDGSIIKEAGPGGLCWHPHFAMAGTTAEGKATWLQAEARDHTRDGVGPNFIAVRGEPGVTVVGSSVALYGCATEGELDAIEAVELAEQLPHPMDGGV